MTDEKVAVANLSLDALRKRVTDQTVRGAFVNLTSRGRVYTFYWLRSAKRLAVKVHPRKRLERLPAVEALAASLEAVWSCPLPSCGKVFERQGKQKFCTPAHATKFRKAKWLRAQARRKKREAAEAAARAGWSCARGGPTPQGRGGHYWGV
jgi:hypothetical protein